MSEKIYPLNESVLEVIKELQSVDPYYINTIDDAIDELVKYGMGVDEADPKKLVTVIYNLNRVKDQLDTIHLSR